MNILKFFLNHFSYQMNKSLDLESIPTVEEYKNYLAFSGILTAMPILGLITFMLITGVTINTGLNNILPEYFNEFLFVFLICFPLLILLILTISYMSYIFKCFKFKKLNWAFYILGIVIINYALYITCIAYTGI